MKTTTFQLPDALHKQLKEIAAREGTDMRQILIKQLEEYIKIHGNGNPVYTLEKWTKDPEFVAVPALLEDFDKIQNWLIKNQKDTKTIRQIKSKIQEWEQLIKNWDYGRLPRHQSNS